MARGIVKGGLNDAGSNVKSIQSGYVSVNETTANVTISAVNLANSIVKITYTNQSAGDTAKNLSIQAKLTNSTNIQFTNGGIYSYPFQVYWEVIEFQNVKSIQKGDYAYTTSGSTTISSVNTSKAMLFFSFYSDSTNSSSNNLSYTVMGGYINSSSVSFYGETFNAYIHWQVVEFN